MIWLLPMRKEESENMQRPDEIEITKKMQDEMKQVGAN